MTRNSEQIGNQTLNARSILNKLHSIYGEQHWWPANSAFEMMCGAILVQNTQWTNVELSINNLFTIKGIKTPEQLLSLTTEDLEKIIQPSGFMKSKARTCQSLSKWILDNDALSQDSKVQQWTNDQLRESLINIRGIGPETADVVRLFAYSRPTFIWSTYARRMLSLFNVGDLNKFSYETCRKRYSSIINTEGFSANEAGELHALIVRSGKDNHEKILLEMASR
ncbi:endonuclease III domain-containing protein [Corynebacterium lowii]|uniref:Endonuclease III n=1 Tax=Corynebacterium lowii TaxID=1544413 RepID=A0A0Q1AJR9_9CORY|nr:hypothetical protein [Corynebacterium lowii]KQB87115.1 Endonuclease III [Corynebacterium lowii]MDP9852299.1 endonuclease-3 related protein [Corynebacterium lowii]